MHRKVRCFIQILKRLMPCGMGLDGAEASHKIHHPVLMHLSVCCIHIFGDKGLSFEQKL